MFQQVEITQNNVDNINEKFKDENLQQGEDEQTKMNEELQIENNNSE